MAEARLRCRCGRVSGRLNTGNGTLIQCHCADCARYRAHLQPGVTHAPGVDIYQTTPDQVDITEGWEHVACLRLSAKGMFRWYASCCNTPLANCLISPTFPFVGVVAESVVEDDRRALGKLRAVVERKAPGGKPDNRNTAAMVWGVMRRGITARLAGTERHAPFFAADGSPAKPPQVRG